MNTFFLPDIGEGLHEAEIVSWHVGVGDHVVADQPLVSIETDKAVVEIPSPQSGRVAAVHGEPGDVIDVGAALVEFAADHADDAGAIVGSLPSAEPQPIADVRSTDANDSIARATPAVRSLASALGIDIGDAEPTGPDGTVTRADVEAVAARSNEASDEPVEPLRGVRRAMDANMTRAHAEVVPATVTDEGDIGDWASDAEPTVRLLRAIARACEHEPALNVGYLGRHRGRLLHDRVDVGIAIDTEDGLFVPVLRDVAGRSADDLRRGIAAMRADVEARTVPPEHLHGATISLSNFGVFGGRHAALVVVPPQVAIVGAGRARDAVVARDGEVKIRRLLPLSLTFDHRVVMGSEATRFLSRLKDDLEVPA